MGTPAPSQEALETLREDLAEREETVVRLHFTDTHANTLGTKRTHRQRMLSHQLHELTRALDRKSVV